MSGYKVRARRRLSLALVFAGLFLGAGTAGAASRIYVNIDGTPRAINAGGQIVGSGAPVPFFGIRESSRSSLLPAPFPRSRETSTTAARS